MLSRCGTLLKQQPATLEQRVLALQRFMRCSDEQLAVTLARAPGLLTQDSEDVVIKVSALQTVMALPPEDASEALIVERCARGLQPHPAPAHACCGGSSAAAAGSHRAPCVWSADHHTCACTCHGCILGFCGWMCSSNTSS